jgi:ribosomal RNA small subunit methyltransferase A
MRGWQSVTSLSQILFLFSATKSIQAFHSPFPDGRAALLIARWGWIQRSRDAEWEWQDDNDPAAAAATFGVEETSSELASASPSEFSVQASATPQLPSGTYRPKQSLGQNYLKDPNTVAKIIRAFHSDASQHHPEGVVTRVVELGPGAGALTDKLVESYGESTVTAIEIDPRSVELLKDKHPSLDVRLQDVLRVNYLEIMQEESSNHQPLTVIGNLPYYITSQILFALADASHEGAIASATVTMQYEVARRMVAQPSTKDYGILSVVFQLYALTKLHFKIPPTVFYPKPKVDSALIGLRFATRRELQERLQGVSPVDLRRVVTTAFQQRRKTLRNSLRKLVAEVKDALDEDAIWSTDEVLGLPSDWSSRRPEQLTPDQFVALTRHVFGAPYEHTPLWPSKVWRKLKHGANVQGND